MMLSLIMAILRPLAYLSVPLVALRYLFSRSPTVKYYVRFFIYLSGLGVFSIYGVFVSIWAALVGRRYDTNFYVAGGFYGCLGPLLGITFEIEGVEHLSTRPSVIIANHQSMFDILFLSAVFPRAGVMTAKKELIWTPLLGMFMWLGGTIFIDRSNNKRAIQSLKDAGETIKRKRLSLFMFAEGTRSSQEIPTIRPLKKGAFHVAVNGQVPIVPVVCENYWRLYHKGVLEGGRLKVRVLPPVPTEDLTSAHVDELAARIRLDMLQVLKEISVPVDDPNEPPTTDPASSAAKLTEITPKVAQKHPLEASRASKGRLVPEAGPRQRTTSLASEETEDDDGAVLVRRPS